MEPSANYTILVLVSLSFCKKRDTKMEENASERTDLKRNLKVNIKAVSYTHLKWGY